MKKRRQFTYILVVFVIILLLGLGYAFLTTTLSINGTTNVDRNTWNVFWDNINVTTGSVTGTQVTTAPTIDTTKTTVTFRVNLKQPGEYYEFTVDAKNTGTIDAMIDTITKTTNIPAYLNYNVTYVDGIEIANKHLLASNSMEKYKIRVEYRNDINVNQLPTANQSISLSFGVTYLQANENAVPVPHPTSFVDDDWSTIVLAVQNGNTSAYNVGDTKTVELGNSLGTHTIRIANTSTPAECETTGFSQTACGFVLEFADVITTHRMNLYTSGDSNLDGSTVNGTGNKGGWEYSDMRAYLNSTIYANENIDYSTTGIYSSLPEVLRNAIINTTVVSGHGSVDTTNYTTTNKLYLLSRREVWNYTGSYDTAQGQTRQLDYYANLGVTESNYSGAIKQRNGYDSIWWLRSARSNYAGGFDCVSNHGGWNTCDARNTYGVSPAFRIG